MANGNIFIFQERLCRFLQVEISDDQVVIRGRVVDVLNRDQLVNLDQRWSREDVIDSRVKPTSLDRVRFAGEAPTIDKAEVFDLKIYSKFAPSKIV
jgi:hypothetical protein